MVLTRTSENCRLPLLPHPLNHRARPTGTIYKVSIAPISYYVFYKTTKPFGSSNTCKQFIFNYYIKYVKPCTSNLRNFGVTKALDIMKVYFEFRLEASTVNVQQDRSALLSFNIDFAFSVSPSVTLSFPDDILRNN